jgi:hypothetical protein
MNLGSSSGNLGSLVSYMYFFTDVWQSLETCSRQLICICVRYRSRLTTYTGFSIVGGAGSVVEGSEMAEGAGGMYPEGLLLFAISQPRNSEASRCDEYRVLHNFHRPLQATLVR